MAAEEAESLTSTFKETLMEEVKTTIEKLCRRARGIQSPSRESPRAIMNNFSRRWVSNWNQLIMT
ncbi:10411_t:CDS:2 [Paraglomus brasilianum]|uniref:10411_t:CDS:1 n=1 Tax=Paraglomus brasilianum TaxID=144538 RepID=A0A9N8ZSQ1_9GLOM|nr:10411_t:CDS:2 [Paraglomus brasilianum]